MELSGWGRFPVVSAELHQPIDADSLASLLDGTNSTASFIPRGAGKSYGDSSLATNIISSRFLDNFIAIDEEKLTICCGAGTDLAQILNICLPRGWFPPVLPGTKFVSVGGAIAADIHGKNHHLDGSFCDYVVDILLLAASGEVHRCSAKENSDLFRASCGGMGLTGMILSATLQFKPVASSSISQRTLTANNLSDCLELLSRHNDSKYSVAWLDCLATGDKLGRSLIYLGEHNNDEATRPPRPPLNLVVPFSTPALLLNKYSMKLFNNTYFNLKKNKEAAQIINYDSYFFPLDRIHHWNRLYGAKGFLQYQFLVPEESAEEAISAVLTKVSAMGKGSFLSVLKKFGQANDNLLSFPQPGYTLTLDFKHEKTLFPLLDELDRIVIGHGGRIYLAKDARMSEETFKAGYTNWEIFLQVKNRIDPKGVFASLQSDRIGLSTLN